MTDMAEVLTLHAFHLIAPVHLDDVNGPWQVECNCDADPIQGESFLAAERAFAAHQAAALSAAGYGLVADAKRGAWAEGHRAGWDDRDDDAQSGWVPSGYSADTDNPYRAAEMRQG